MMGEGAAQRRGRERGVSIEAGAMLSDGKGGEQRRRLSDVCAPARRGRKYMMGTCGIYGVGRAHRGGAS